MNFTLRSETSKIEVIAIGKAIRILAKLKKAHGKGRWRKLKGEALVELPNEESIAQSYTGTRPTASDARI